MTTPIIVGGNGHSGTRIFAEILLQSNIYMGLPGLSYDRKSKDLNIRGLMNRWIKPYLLSLSAEDECKMQRAFKRRLRLLIPVRSRPWGFKNPRAMFLLPFYHEIFPELQFIHVIRDGRDMCFGNPFVDSPTLWGFVSDDEIAQLSKEERMMRFWGESNRRVKMYGESRLGDRYLRIRFEDLCDHPEVETQRIVDFIGGAQEKMPALAGLVRKPRSIGRWRKFEAEKIDKVESLGEEYLLEFGYS